MLISERIFDRLKEKGMTQKEFTDLTGITPSTISDWKRKKTNPSADKILLICDVLNMSVYELLSGTENKNYRQLDYIIVDKASKEYLLVEEFRKLDKGKRNRLFGYLEALSDIKTKE